MACYCGDQRYCYCNGIKTYTAGSVTGSSSMYYLKGTDQYYIKEANSIKSKSSIPLSIQPSMTVEKALDSLQKTCENVKSDCIEIATLRAAGWEIRIDQVMSYDDRKGFQITLLEPKDKSK